MSLRGLPSNKSLQSQRRPHCVQVATRPCGTAKAAASQVLQETASSPVAVPSPFLSLHPDAIKRRKAQEERRKQRQAELEKERQLHALNLKWYEGPLPDNMAMCSTASDYKQLLAKANAEGRLLVAKFFTSDCWVCKSLHPKIKQMATENPDVIWVKLNGSDPKLVDLFHTLGITKVPMFHFVKDGELVGEMTSSLSPEKLSLLRAELEAQKPPSMTPVSVKSLVQSQSQQQPQSQQSSTHAVSQQPSTVVV